MGFAFEVTPPAQYPLGLQSWEGWRVGQQPSQGVCGDGSPCGPQGDADAYGSPVVSGVTGTIETMQDTVDDRAKDIVRTVANEVCSRKAKMPASKNAVAPARSSPRLKTDDTDRVSGPGNHFQAECPLFVCWLTSSLGMTHHPTPFPVVTRYSLGLAPARR